MTPKKSLTKHASSPASSGPVGLDTVTAAILNSSRSFAGPLPPPEMLIEYEKALPGLSERIVHSFEKESEHRRESDRFQQTMIQTYYRDQSRLAFQGQWFGFVVAMVVLLLAGLLGMLGKTAAAGIVAGIDITCLTSVFVIHQVRQTQNKELPEKTSP